MSQKVVVTARGEKIGARAEEKRAFFDFLMMAEYRTNPVTTRVHRNSFSALACDYDEFFIDETTKL